MNTIESPSAEESRRIVMETSKGKEFTGKRKTKLHLKLHDGGKK